MCFILLDLSEEPKTTLRFPEDSDSDEEPPPSKVGEHTLSIIVSYLATLLFQVPAIEKGKKKTVTGKSSVQVGIFI